MEECLTQGVWVTRAKRLKGQEMAERRPSIRIAVCAGLGKKEIEKGVGVLKGVIVKILSRRR